MRRIAVVLAVCFAVGPFAAGRAAEDVKALYTQKCAACHGPDGKGTAMGQKLGAPDLAKEAKESEKEIAKDIAEGKPPKMAAFKSSLSPEQIQALAKYLKNGMK